MSTCSNNCINDCKPFLALLIVDSTLPPVATQIGKFSCTERGVDRFIIYRLIGIKDKNITLTKVFQHETHIEVQATLDYTPPKCCHCQGKQIKYDFQKPSKIPFIEIGGLPSLIRLKKRRFQCKDCHKVTVSETSLVQKNCQISELVKQKTAQLLLNREALTHIAEKLAIFAST